MATTKEEISGWFDRGIRDKQDFMFVVVDSYDHEDYPVYCTADDFEKTFQSNNGKDMQHIMEIYDLHRNREEQLSMHRCFSYPKEFLMDHPEIYIMV